MSLPLRKCGLKWGQYLGESITAEVTSLAEVWIEIAGEQLSDPGESVTSLAEVWIEIEIDSNMPIHPYCHFPCGSVD